MLDRYGPLGRKPVGSPFDKHAIGVKPVLAAIKRKNRIEDPDLRRKTRNIRRSNIGRV